MEKQLLKKSGIIAVIITFLALAFWFGFSKISLGDNLGTSTWPKGNLKKDSVVDEELIILCGPSGSGIVFGTTSGKWVGTPTDSTLARIFFNITTSQLEFKLSGTTTSYPFGSVTVAYLDANYATIAALSSYLLSTGGAGTNNTFYNPALNSVQLNGSTTIGTGSTITAGTSTFAGTKVGFLADVESPIGADIASKLTIVGTPTTYIAMVQGGGKTGTKSANFSAGSGMVLTTTNQPDGAVNFSYAASGSLSAKADIQEDGTTTVPGAEFLNFKNSDFNIALNGLGADISLAVPDNIQLASTTTVAAANSKGQMQLYKDIGTTSSCLILDGIGSCITVPDNDAWTLTGSGTIGEWVNFAVVSGQLVAQFQNANEYWNIKINGTNLEFEHTTGGATTIQIAGAWTPSTNTWYYVELDKSANDFYLFAGQANGTATLIASGTDADPWVNNTGSLCFGARNSGGISAVNGKLDDAFVIKGSALHTASFFIKTIPQANAGKDLMLHLDGTHNATAFIDSSSNNFPVTAVAGAKITAYGSIISSNYNRYNYRYYDPVAATLMMQITTGTATDSPVVSVLGTNTILCVGTTTPYTGTSNTYSIQTLPGYGILTGNVGLYCYEDIKVPVASGDIVQDEAYEIIQQGNITKHHPRKIVNGKLVKVDMVIAENKAKEDYIQASYSDDYIQWKINNPKGSLQNFETEYRTKKELEWATALNQTELINKKKIELESDMSQTNISLISSDPYTPRILISGNADKPTLSVGNSIGVLWGALQKQIKISNSQHAEIEDLRKRLQ